MGDIAFDILPRRPMLLQSDVKTDSEESVTIELIDSAHAGAIVTWGHNGNPVESS
jgi:hypothetical protein